MVTWENAWTHTRSSLESHLRGCDLRPYSFQEAITHINLTKSPGWPYTLRYNTKKEFFDDPHTFAAYLDYDDSLESGPVNTVETLFLKNELRPIAKCQPGMARAVFVQHPLAVLWGTCKLKSLDHNLISQSARGLELGHFSAVGLTPFYGNFHRMVCLYGDYAAFELDASAFDTSMFREVHQAIATLRSTILRHTPRLRTKTRHYYSALQRSWVVLPHGRVEVRPSGNPSGQGCTTVDNSCWSNASVVYSLMRIGFTLRDIARIKLFIFGDDVLLLIPRDLLPKFDSIKFCLVAQGELGITYTISPTGSGITDCKWLNFGFQKQGELWWPALDPIKMCSSLAVRIGDAPTELTFIRACGIRNLSRGNTALFRFLDAYVQFLVKRHSRHIQHLLPNILTPTELESLFHGTQVGVLSDSLVAAADAVTVLQSAIIPQSAQLLPRQNMAPRKVKNVRSGSRSGSGRPRAPATAIRKSQPRVRAPPRARPPVPRFVAQRPPKSAPRARPIRALVPRLRATAARLRTGPNLGGRHWDRYGRIVRTANRALGGVVPDDLLDLAGSTLTDAYDAYFPSDDAPAPVLTEEKRSQFGAFTAPVQFPMKTHRAKFNTRTGAGGEMLVSGKDRLVTVTNGTNTTGAIVHNFFVNPTVLGADRLYRLSSLYDQYEVVKFVVHFSHSAATSASGQMRMAFVMDPTDEIPEDATGLKSLATTEGTVAFSTYTSAACIMPRPMSGRFYIEGDATSDSDKRLTQAALFTMRVEVPSNLAANTPIGTLWVEYVVRLRKPMVQDNFVGSSSVWLSRLVSNTPSNFGAIFGSGGAAPLPADVYTPFNSASVTRTTGVFTMGGSASASGINGDPTSFSAVYKCNPGTYHVSLTAPVDLTFSNGAICLFRLGYAISPTPTRAFGSLDLADIRACAYRPSFLSDGPHGSYLGTMFTVETTATGIGSCLFSGSGIVTITAEKPYFAFAFRGCSSDRSNVSYHTANLFNFRAEDTPFATPTIVSGEFEPPPYYAAITFTRTWTNVAATGVPSPIYPRAYIPSTDDAVADLRDEIEDLRRLIDSQERKVEPDDDPPVLVSPPKPKLLPRPATSSRAAA